jgi:MFS family permease
MLTTRLVYVEYCSQYVPMTTYRFLDADFLKWTFLTFFLIFELGSVLSGAATSSPFLIVGRAIAGVGAAGLMSGTLSIVAVVVSMRLRALYTGILSAMFGVSMVSGPLLGGAFTQHVSCKCPPGMHLLGLC